jgi:hypothetical protein
MKAKGLQAGAGSAHPRAEPSGGFFVNKIRGVEHLLVDKALHLFIGLPERGLGDPLRVGNGQLRPGLLQGGRAVRKIRKHAGGYLVKKEYVAGIDIQGDLPAVLGKDMNHLLPFFAFFIYLRGKTPDRIISKQTVACQ